MKMLTQKEANKLERKMGAIPIGEYKNSYTKREYKCVDCGNSYFIEPKILRHNKRFNCSKCGHRRGSNKLKHSIHHIRTIIIKKGFKPLFYDDDYINNKTKIKVSCKCGQEFKTTFHDINDNSTLSCGHCNDPKIGDRFNKLTIIIIKQHKNRGSAVKCLCDCGNETKWYKSSIITKGGVSSCGCIVSNGERLIEKYLKDNNIIYIKQKVFDNCKNKRCLRFDFYLPDYNLCIEYNGIQHYKPINFNHNDKDLNYSKQRFIETKKRDKIKKQYCKQNNIKLLIIKYTNYNDINKILKKQLKEKT